MDERVKVVVTVPESKADAIRRAIGEAGGGEAGSYSFCSFSVKGSGRFLPQEGAHPTIGQVGKLETVAEERVEVTCSRKAVKAVVQAIRAVHPYEEPVIDVFPLLSI